MERVYKIKTAEMLGVCAIFTGHLDFGEAAEVIHAVAAVWRQMAENAGAEEYNLEGIQVAYGLSDEGMKLIGKIFDAFVQLGLRKLYENPEFEP